MIKDVTGIELTPGYFGYGCLGNGGHLDESGNSIMCCCNECSYLICCGDDHDPKTCKTCTATECPRAGWDWYRGKKVKQARNRQRKSSSTVEKR